MSIIGPGRNDMLLQAEDSMAAMVARLHDNNRPVQPLGDRRIGLVSR